MSDDASGYYSDLNNNFPDTNYPMNSKVYRERQKLSLNKRNSKEFCFDKNFLDFICFYNLNTRQTQR